MIVSKLDQLKLSVVSHNHNIAKKQILDNTVCAPLAQFAQAVFPPGEKVAAHSHADMTEVFFVQSGSGTIRVNDTRITLSPGTTVTVQPGEQHELDNTGEQDLVILYFGLIE